MTRPRRLVASRALVWTAGVAGVTHAGFSMYWALGGRWLLATVGEWAVRLSIEAPRLAGLALGVVGITKLLAATIPIGVAYSRVPHPRFWRGLSWAGGLLLVAYGATNTIVALAVLCGVVGSEGGYDQDAMKGHAFWWDPLFVIWGGALVLSLWLSGSSSRTASPRPDAPAKSTGHRALSGTTWTRRPF